MSMQYAVRRPLAASLLVAAAVLAGATRPASGDEPTPKPGKADKGDAVVAPAQPKESHEADVRGGSPSGRVTITNADGRTVTCREQSPQPFLVRGNWFPKTHDAEEIKHGRKLLEQAIRYRTETYGYFEGFGRAKWNKYPPRHYAKTTTFMGMKVTVHEKIVPALKCVEAALNAGHAHLEYSPHSIGGIRYKNTYRGVEVSNHVYGIAVDIEPDRNSCCGCVKPWPNNPLCKKKASSIFERMAMPKSWVDTFERFGFYWLGHDVLRDTMHFEFLGDPDKIVETAAK